MKFPRRPFQFGLVASLTLIAVIALVAWLADHYLTLIGVLLSIVISVPLLMVSLRLGPLQALDVMRRTKASRKDHTMDLLRVEFVGGPFDGDIHPFPCPPQIEMLGLPVTPTGIVPFTGDPPTAWTPATSFAFYKLRQNGSNWKYVYVESRPGHEAKLDRNDPVIKAALEAGRLAVERRNTAS